MSIIVKAGASVFINSERAKGHNFANLRGQQGAIVGFTGGHALVTFNAAVMEKDRRYRHIHEVRFQGHTFGAFRLPVSILVTRETLFVEGVWSVGERNLSGVLLRHEPAGRRAAEWLAGAEPASNLAGKPRVRVQGRPVEAVVVNPATISADARRLPFHHKIGDRIERTRDHQGGRTFGLKGDIAVVIETNADNSARNFNSYHVRRADGTTAWWAQGSVKAAAQTTVAAAVGMLSVHCVVRGSEEEAARKAYIETHKTVKVAHEAWLAARADLGRLEKARADAIRDAENATKAMERELLKAAGIDYNPVHAP